jgi:REP element-mobilizing transposase RayT
MPALPFPFSKSIRLPDDAYTNPENTFHIVFHAMPETAPFRGPTGEVVWRLIVSEVERPAVHLLAACLMPDHFHALVKPGDRSLIRWADGFKSYSTRAAWHGTARKVLWQPGFYDRRIRDEAEYESTLYYIEQNPVASGLVPDAGLWPWLYIARR